MRAAAGGGRTGRFGSLLIACGLLLVVEACAETANTTTAPVRPTSTTTTTTTTTTAPPPTIPEHWVWGVDTVDLGDGYRLGPCSGDADQFACISRDGALLGAAERLALPVDTFPALAGVDDPVESIAVIAADFVTTFSADRQATCPDLAFIALEPAQVTVARTPGLRFGFEELDGEVVVERVVQYGARIGGNVTLFNFTAIAPGACLAAEGELTDPAVLDLIGPGLEAVVAVVEPG